ncbi:hypothetical protein Nepgr_027443 [Nepenthes gracilis]|uniref:Uncharacterized protein n=1 Tax=Nepenthes gracilis TaxID=150966 RepID=A0AAD3T9V9_NEPGR|nr:hypothetical protein Nepgr_027443 [Nepenthes gracilis]
MVTASLPGSHANAAGNHIIARTISLPPPCHCRYNHLTFTVNLSPPIYNTLGKTWLAGLSAALELLKGYDNVCTLRLRMSISSDLNTPQNFIAKISRYNKVVNIPNSTSVLDELLPTSIGMAKRNLKGTWKFTNPVKVIVAARSNDGMDVSELKGEFSDLLPTKDLRIKSVFEAKKKTDYST